MNGVIYQAPLAALPIARYAAASGCTQEIIVRADLSLSDFTLNQACILKGSFARVQVPVSGPKTHRDGWKAVSIDRKRLFCGLRPLWLVDRTETWNWVRTMDLTICKLLSVQLFWPPTAQNQDLGLFLPPFINLPFLWHYPLRHSLFLLKIQTAVTGWDKFLHLLRIFGLLRWDATHS